MKLKKRGTDSSIRPNTTCRTACVQFAQSPQALVFEDFVRIYFLDARAVDTTNAEYLSHIAFVDMRKDLREIIRVSTRNRHPARWPGLLRRARHLSDERDAPRRPHLRLQPAAGTAGFRCRSTPASAWPSAATTA